MQRRAEQRVVVKPLWYNRSSNAYVRFVGKSDGGDGETPAGNAKSSRYHSGNVFLTRQGDVDSRSLASLRHATTAFRSLSITPCDHGATPLPESCNQPRVAL